MVRLWDTRGARKHRDLLTRGKVVGSVRCVSFSHDGTQLLAADDHVRDDAWPGCCLWEAATGKVVWNSDDKVRGIASAAFARSVPLFACTRVTAVRCYSVPNVAPHGQLI